MSLEELISSELEGTLEEVTSKSGADTGKESTSTLLCDDLSETTNHTLVVDLRIKLDTGLDAVSRQKSMMLAISVN